MISVTPEQLIILQEYFQNTIYAQKLLEGYLAPRQGSNKHTYNLHGLTEYELNDFLDLWEDCDDTQKNNLLKSFFIEFSGEEKATIEQNIDVYRKVFETNIINHERWNSPDLHNQINSLLTRKHADNAIEQSVIVKFAENIDKKKSNYLKNNDSRRYFNECLTEAERSQVVDMINDSSISDLSNRISAESNSLSSIEITFLNFVKSISLDKNFRKEGSEIFSTNDRYLSGFNVSYSDNKIKSDFIRKITEFINLLKEKAENAAINAADREKIESISLQSTYNKDSINEYIKHCNEYVRNGNKLKKNHLEDLRRVYKNACYIQNDKESGFKYNNAKILDELIKKLDPIILEEALSKNARETTLHNENKHLSKSNYHEIINKTINAKPQLDMLVVIRDYCSNQSRNKDSLGQSINDFIKKYPKGVNPNHNIPTDINKSHDSISTKFLRTVSSRGDKKTLAQTINNILIESKLTEEERNILQEFIEKSFVLYEVYKPNTDFNKINSSLLKSLNFSGSDIKQLDLSGTNIEELDLSDCKSLTTLSGIPTSLKILNLGQSAIQILDLSESNIETLDLSGSQVEKLELGVCSSLTSLSGIPSSLKKLDLSGSNIETLDLSGSQVEELNLGKSLTSLSGIPNSLKILNLSESGIKTLDLSGSQVEELDLHDCKNFTTLSGIPTSLKELYLSRSDIQTLDLSGSQVEKLYLSYCRSLTTLSGIPSSLKILHLRGSKIETPDLSGSQVEELDLRSLSR